MAARGAGGRGARPGRRRGQGDPVAATCLLRPSVLAAGPRMLVDVTVLEARRGEDGYALVPGGASAVQETLV